MKITIGGNVGYKISGKPYESMEANTYFSMEVDKELSEAELSETFDKVNKILENEAVKKLKVAYTAYIEKVSKLRNSNE